MADILKSLPKSIQGPARVLLRRAAGGAARYQKSGDISGRDAQRELSALLQEAGVLKTDPLYKEVINYGRKLYDGRLPPP